MTTPFRFFASAALCAWAALTSLTAQAEEAATEKYDPARYLIANIKSGSTQDAYLANLLEAFRAIDNDTNGLDRSDIMRIEQAKQVELAKKQRQFERSLERQRTEFTRGDKNSNGRMTAEEFLAATNQQQEDYAEAARMMKDLDAAKSAGITRDQLAPKLNLQPERLFERLDFNGDELITRPELSAYVERGKLIETQLRSAFTQIDQNRDEQLTFEELFAAQQNGSSSPPKQAERGYKFERLFALDENGDGIVAEAELTSAFHRQFAQLDSNADQTISAQEYAAAKSNIAIARGIVDAPFCAIPKPKDNEMAVAFATNSGQLASYSALGDQGKETSIVDVVIEPGNAPLFVVLSAYGPVIWQFKGELERVSRVVVFAEHKDTEGNALAAVSGLPSKAVAFAEPGCFPSNEAVSGSFNDPTKLFQFVGAVTGISANAIGRPGTNGSVAMPSLTVKRFREPMPAPEGFDPYIWRSGLASYSRGIAHIDAAELVTDTSVEAYDLLPSEFGLAALSSQGVLKPTQHSREYRIVKPLNRFPIGLSSISFVLDEGIARPEGKLRAGCLYSSDGVTAIEGKYCSQFKRVNSVQVRVNEGGKACLFRDDDTNAGCFPDDGRALKAVETPEGQKFVPEEPSANSADELVTVQTARPPAPASSSNYHSTIELIPTDLRQKW